MLSTFLRFIPKIGPFRAMAFNNPTAQTEDLYFKSINITVRTTTVFISSRLAPALSKLSNSDLDSGKETRAAEYSLTDDTYAKLLEQLTARKFDLTDALALRDNILHFYGDLSAPITTKKDEAQWQGVLVSLDVSCEIDSSGAGTCSHRREVSAFLPIAIDVRQMNRKLREAHLSFGCFQQDRPWLGRG